MIEAVPLSTDSIMIVVTKVDDPNQIEERLEALSMDENNTDIEGSLIKLQKELDIGTLK